MKQKAIAHALSPHDDHVVRSLFEAPKELDNRCRVIREAVPEMAITGTDMRFDFAIMEWVMVMCHNGRCVRWAFIDDDVNGNSLSAEARECIIMAIQSMVATLHHDNETSQGCY